MQSINISLYRTRKYRTLSKRCVYLVQATFSSNFIQRASKCLDIMRSLFNETARPIRKATPIPHICVVGAGVSGLRCADILIQNGFKVTILEARDRVGGRMHQAKLPSGSLVDLGPNWIHGSENNPILDLAEETKTPTRIWDEGVQVFGEDGQAMENGDDLNKSFWGIIEEAFSHSAANSSNIRPEESLYDFITLKITEMYSNDDQTEERKILMQMAENWGAFVGSSVKTQSLKFFWLEQCIDGENLFCAGTYQKILQRIAKPALDSADVKLLTKVTSVESIEQKVQVQTESTGSQEFDEVVITAPLGWLQKNKTIFSPALPETLSKAIDSIGYGCLEKVYISFPRAFWLGEPADQKKSPISSFTMWLKPAYAEDTNPERWNQELVDLASLPESCAQATLLFYIFGDQSVSLTKKLSNMTSETAKNEFLEKFFVPYYSRLPHYDLNSQDSKPSTFLATSWVLDDLAGNGSYSNFQTGLEEGDEDIRTMRYGLPDRRVWFAGEHTAPFVALGTVTGAYWSGEAIGRRISDAYGRGSSAIGELHNDGDELKNDTSHDVNPRGLSDLKI